MAKPSVRTTINFPVDVYEKLSYLCETFEANMTETIIKLINDAFNTLKDKKG